MQSYVMYLVLGLRFLVLLLMFFCVVCVGDEGDAGVFCCVVGAGDEDEAGVDVADLAGTSENSGGRRSVSGKCPRRVGCQGATCSILIFRER